MPFNILNGPDLSSYPDDGIIVPRVPEFPVNFRVYHDIDTFSDACTQIAGYSMAKKMVRHERQHSDVAYAVGISAVCYTISRVPGGIRPGMCVLEGSHPKLAYAALTAAPQDPSDNDLLDIQRLGYDGIEDVGDRIVEWNKHNDMLQIPLPATYSAVGNKPSNTGWRFWKRQQPR